jgi:hypothetical protein
MRTTVIGQPGHERSGVSRERSGVIGIAALVILTVGGYLAVRSSTDAAGSLLLPYQALLKTLPSPDQTMFGELQRRVLELEDVRAKSGRWPDGSAVRIDAPYRWGRTGEGFFVNYLGLPAADQSAGAWLLVVQEPDPQAPVDTAPNDETHHRLPDGTVLHVTIWTHRFGGQLAPGFVRQPETAGWTQVLTAPVAPSPFQANQR